MPDRSDNMTTKTKKTKKYDILPKLLCLIAAFILWLYVTQVETADYEETFNNVTVMLTNDSVLENEKGLRVYNGRGNTVNVTVSGKKSDINRYNSEHLSVTADVSNITTPGKHTVSITADAPSEIKVSHLSQTTIDVYVDESASIDVDIKPKVSTGIFKDCELGEIAPEYSTVTVTGPRTVLDTISHAEVSLNLGTVTSSVSTIGTIDLISKNGEEIDMRYVQLNRSEVKVSVPVYTTKSVPLTVDYKHGYYNDKNVKITFDPAVVEVKGDPVALSTLTSVSVGSIDEKAITGDSMQVYLLKLPEGIISVDNVETVNVSIAHKGTVIQTFSVDEIKVTGASDKNIEVLTKSVSARLRGTKAELDKVAPEDITVTVNLSEYSKAVNGTITANATVAVKGASSNLYPIGEYPVQVKIG